MKVDRENAVISVVAGGAADTSGVRVGDVVWEVDGSALGPGERLAQARPTLEPWSLADILALTLVLALGLSLALARILILPLALTFALALALALARILTQARARTSTPSPTPRARSGDRLQPRVAQPQGGVHEGRGGAGDRGADAPAHLGWPRPARRPGERRLEA
eukprot:6124024-Prymnesium_polylepis.1